MEKERILVVDDSPDTLEMIRRILTHQKYRVFTAESVDAAMGLLENDSVELVITDLKMPRVSGLELVRYLRENHPDTGVMMITGYATIEGAVSAVKAGVGEYLPKPFTEDELLSAVGGLLEKIRQRRQVETGGGESRYGIIGSSEPMQKVFNVIKKAAETTATVLITGESGTGKELVARAIHYHGNRASGPFVPVNCAAIPPELLESELFGHQKGSFTGAVATRPGFFQTAREGTIFLDEVGELSLPMQAKLLRVIQDRQVYMVGARSPEKVDLRIITATNKDLWNLVEKQLFREDLYYRLNVINLELPPLKERTHDIPSLMHHFARRFALELGKPLPRFTDEALEACMGYAWPGNVRELENLIQRLIVMVDGQRIDVPDLPPHMHRQLPRNHGLERSLAEVEQEHIRKVLEYTGGNKSRAARILGIDRKTLRGKLDEGE